MTGIYGGDGAQLSLQATFPNLRALELEHGSVIRGLAGQSVESPGAFPPFVTLGVRHPDAGRSACRASSADARLDRPLRARPAELRSRLRGRARGSRAAAGRGRRGRRSRFLRGRAPRGSRFRPGRRPRGDPVRVLGGRHARVRRRRRRTCAGRLRLPRAAGGGLGRSRVQLDFEQVGGSRTQGLGAVARVRRPLRRARRHSRLRRRARRARPTRAAAARDRGGAQADPRPPLAPRNAAVRPRPSRRASSGSTPRLPTIPGLRSPEPRIAESASPTASTPVRKPRARSRSPSCAFPDDARDVRAALRRGSRADAGWRLVAGARVPGGRRRPALHRARRGRVPRRRRRQPLSRLRPLLGAADPRARASACGRSARGGGPPRDELRRAEPARARARAARPRLRCRASSSCASSARAPRRP